MPRSEQVIQVFVGSPNDVRQEREALENIFTEQNKTWSKSIGVRLELIKWETDVIPGISSEPQAVINEQIGEEYDVFIAIFWGRYRYRNSDCNIWNY